MNVHMQMPERVIIDETSTNFHGKFILQPLEQGFGVTIGNSLRRVLLSSIPGAAIIGVKITDVLHEFQTIPGVIEDVSEIILNLKEVRLTMNDKKMLKVLLHLKGPGQWTARDIQESNNQILIINPDHVIANLAEDAEFEVELRIGKGKGYLPAEEQQISDYPIGMMPIDAVFTPIKNVIFNVEPFRVGQKTDYEKLILDILTDGTITAEEALHLAAKILSDHINLFISFDDKPVNDEPLVEVIEDQVKSVERERLRKILTTPVEELELSVRAYNCLKTANIKNLSELVSLQESELLKFRNFGRKSLAELAEVVANYGLEFGMNVEHYLKDDPKSDSND